MTKLTYRLLLLSVLVSAAAAADKDDPSGWTTAKWGMSETEVRTSTVGAQTLTTPINSRTFYKTNAGVNDKWTASLGVPSLTLAGSQWRVYFLFDPAKGLSRVILQPIDDASVSAQEFQETESLIAAKYGHPFSQEGSSEFPSVRNSQWSFPTTTISLRHANYRAKLPMETLSLTYERRVLDVPI